MGVNLVKSAYRAALRHPVNPTPKVLLVHMALTALDVADGPTKPARRYFGGRTLQAFALGYSREQWESDAARSAVKRAVSELVAKRYLVVLEAGGFGRPTTYELQLRGDVRDGSDLMVWEPEERPVVQVSLTDHLHDRNSRARWRRDDRWSVSDRQVVGDRPV